MRYELLGWRTLVFSQLIRRSFELDLRPSQFSLIVWSTAFSAANAAAFSRVWFTVFSSGCLDTSKTDLIGTRDCCVCLCN